MNVCQRHLVNEVLGPLVTEFVPNFGREGATPIQRGSNASLLHRVQAIKLIRHRMRGSGISEAPLSPLVAFCAHQVQSGAGKTHPRGAIGSSKRCRSFGTGP